MQHYAAFHLGLHFLQRYSFRGFPTKRVKQNRCFIWHDHIEYIVMHATYSEMRTGTPCVYALYYMYEVIQSKNEEHKQYV